MKIYGARTTEFQSWRAGGAEGCSGFGSLRPAALRRMFPLMSGHARRAGMTTARMPRGGGGGGGGVSHTVLPTLPGRRDTAVGTATRH